MKSGHRNAARSTRTRDDRRHPENETCRRFVDAWGDPADHRGQSAPVSSRATPWRRFRELSSTRTARVVMIAPLGAIGAYLLIRRRR